MGNLTIKQITGDVLNSGAPVIAHQVNCQGVMGAGVAKCVREKYPDIMNTYSRWCREFDSEYLLGMVLDYRVNENQIIANCFAQDKTGFDRQTNYEAFYSCLERLKTLIKYYGFERRIAFPYNIGCGLGGGDWDIIFAMIKSVFSKDGDYTIEFWSLEDFGFIPAAY